MRLLCLTALSISGYLAWTSFQTGEVFGCSGGELIDCDHVLHSKYAKVLGIPVTVPAFALYATLLSVLFFFRKATPESLLKAGWMVLTVGAISAAGAAVWFTGLQFADWKFCPYCLVAHTCGLILASIVLLNNPLDRQSRTGFSGMAITGVLAMVALQWQAEAPPTFTVETFPASQSEGQPASEEAFGAPGEFAAPAADSAKEFGAPVTFNAPMEFTPPSFDAPGFEAPRIKSQTNEGPDGSVQPKNDPQRARLAALVPPPIDITKPNQTVNKPTESDVLEADKTEPVSSGSDADSSLLPVEALEGAQPTRSDTKLAEAEYRSSVEYTPPMEVPVIFATDGAEIQRVDFRSEINNGSSPESDGDAPAEDSAVAPSTSQRETSNGAEDEPIQTAVSEPTGLQVSNSTNRSAMSAKAMGYLFFSASGATNAALSEVLMLNTLPPASSDGESKSGIRQTDDKSGNAKDVEQKAETPKKERLVVVAGNRFSLNPKHWPLIGKPDADFIFVEMFDYTCPHCRVTHKAIEGAFEKYGDRLAVITLPVPLERACNSTVTGMGTPGACEMAKLAVAVWRIERSKFADYHQYMCSNQRTVAAARAKAEQLVGKEKLAAEMAMPFATDYIKKHVELYRRVGQGSVPKLMFPRSTLTGEIQQASVLVNAIKRELDK